MPDAQPLQRASVEPIAASPIGAGSKHPASARHGAGSKHPASARHGAGFVRQAAPCSIEFPLPAVQRAALAIALGKPSELRRLARDLQRASQYSEAGLLENYALLLERSNVRPERVLAEVTRMLRASAAERRSARRAAPAISWPPNATAAQQPNGVVTRPPLDVGARRRALR